MKNLTLVIFLIVSLPVLSQDFLPVDYPLKVKYSPEGYTLLTGQSINGNILIRYYDGTEDSWTEEFISPFSTPNDRGIDITADASKNVYVTGYVYDDNCDALRKIVIKYSSSGGHQWSTIFEDNDWESSGISIVVDGNNIYSCGFITDHDQGTERDFYVQKLGNSFGNVLWTYQYNDDEFKEDDVATSLLVDNNFLYVMGYSYRGETNLNDIVLIGLDKSTGYEEPDYPEIYSDASGNQYPTDFTFAEDVTGDVRKYKTVATGTSDNINTSNPGYDYLTLYFDSGEGSPLLWAKQFDGGSTDIPISVTVDNDYHVIVTGYSMKATSDYDFATLRYDKTNGDPLFTGNVYYFDNNSGIDQGTSVVAGNYGIFVTGYSEESETGFYTVAYHNSHTPGHTLNAGNTNIDGRDSTGDDKIIWKDHHIPKFSSSIRSERKSYAKSTLDKNGNIIVTGVMADENGFRYCIYSYDRSGRKRFEYEDDGRNYRNPAGNMENTGGIVSTNYPNPFNPVTKITYTIPVNGHVSVKVYNMLGQLVGELVNEFKTGGSHFVNFNASHLSSGVYYYRIETGRFVETKKILLIK